jgi:hypothetical protein
MPTTTAAAIRRFQVRNFRRFSRRALELAGRRPWLAFFNLRCVFDMTSLGSDEKHGSIWDSIL